MKTQSEFARLGEGTTYYEQYFETQTLVLPMVVNDIPIQITRCLRKHNKFYNILKRFEQSRKLKDGNRILQQWVKGHE